MRISIEARALSAQGGGVRRYTLELIRNLVMQSKDEMVRDEYRVVVDHEKAAGLIGDAEVMLIPRGSDWMFPWWFQRALPDAMGVGEPDVVHYTKAAVPKKKVAPTVVTIYDVIPMLFPESQKLLQRYYWPKTIETAVERSDHIMTISEASKRDLQQFYNVSDDNVTVTPLAVDLEHFYPREQADGQGVVSFSEPYVLFVATLEPRKNVLGLLRAFKKIVKDVPHRLVIAGKRYKGYEAILAEIDVLELRERVALLDFISHEELPFLYSGASLFVWPSVYEGWGFPPQEAMACGVPVIVSNGGPLPEVVGDAGVVVPFEEQDVRKRGEDQDFEKRLADKMRLVLTTPALQTDLRDRGLARVQQFSWENVARNTRAVYEGLV